MNWPPESDRNEPLVKPMVGGNTPKLGPTAVLVSSTSDMRLLENRLDIDPADERPLFMSRLYPDAKGRTGFSIAGPMVGAPYAVMVLENLIAWGVRRCIFVGWCGALSECMDIGDIVLPSAAIADEGTSQNYSGGWQAVAAQKAESDGGDIFRPSPGIRKKMREALNGAAIPFQEGIVWSTDAIYRETPLKVAHYTDRGAIAVEMEVASLFAAAAFHNVEAGAFLIVSDILSACSWKPGFRDPRFKHGRKQAIAAAAAFF